MTYNDGWTGQPSKSVDWGYEKGPGAFDIAAIQALYGANMSYHTGDDIYLLPTANVSGTGWTTIWDAGGTLDTIEAPLNAGSATIDLRAATLTPNDPNAGGYVSWVKGIAGGFTIAHGVSIENATGGSGNDKLTGNEIANILDGRGGADRMEGLGGNDTYYVDNVGVEAVPVTRMSRDSRDRARGQPDTLNPAIRDRRYWLTKREARTGPLPPSQRLPAGAVPQPVTARSAHCRYGRKRHGNVAEQQHRNTNDNNRKRAGLWHIIFGLSGAVRSGKLAEQRRHRGFSCLSRLSVWKGAAAAWG